MAASAPSRRRGSSSSTGVPRWVWVAAGAVLLVAVFVFLHRRNSSSSTLDTSGTPGPDLTGSVSNLAPSGGASGGDAGQLPAMLLSQPDTLQQQVQQTDAGAATAADTSSSTGAATASTTTTSSSPSVAPGAPLSSQYVDPYAGLGIPHDSYFTAGVASHPGTVGTTGGMVAPNYAVLAPSAGNARRPGLQV